MRYLLAFLCLTSAAYAEPPKFTPLGRFGFGTSLAQDVSADGSVIVGTVYDPSLRDFLAFRWTAGDIQTTPFYKPYAASRPRVSDDGSVVALSRKVGSGAEAIRWLADGTIEPLGGFGPATQYVFGIDADGSTVVGANFPNDANTISPVRWTASGGIDQIGDRFGFAHAVSGDGSLIAGSIGNGPYTGIIWPDGTPLGLPGAINTWPQGMSADGSLIAGFSTFRAGLSAMWDEAFIWTAATGSVNLGAGRHTVAWDVSPDGSVVVGGNFIGSEAGAFFWTSETGTVNIQSWLSQVSAADLDGWNLTHAMGVSADGQTIVGTGTHFGETEAWAITVPRFKKFTQGDIGLSVHSVPEPSSVVLVIVAVACLLAVSRARNI
jgi:uncharacterized membrane protein